MAWDKAHAGALAFARNGDPNIREFKEATVLKTFGEIREDFAELGTASSTARQGVACDDRSRLAVPGRVAVKRSE